MELVPGGYGEDTRPILLVTTVDIGDGQAGKIEIREGDDPIEAAREFCQRYGLPEAIVGPLSQHILENIERSNEEQEQAHTGSHKVEDPPAVPPPAQPSQLDDLESFLPDDSPAARGAPAMQRQPSYQQQPVVPAYERSGLSSYDQPALTAYQQPTGPVYEHSERSAQPSYAQEAAVSAGYSGQATHCRRSSSRDEAVAPPQRPASAPYPHETAARPGPADIRRPASVNGNYGMRKDPGSTSSGSSGGSSGRVRSSSSNPAAYSRLYADYFSKQSRLEEERRLRDLDVQLKMQQVHVTPVSQHLACHRNSAGYKNYGERLYVEGRLDAMRKEKEAMRIKQQQEEEQLAECVFRPEISKLARTLKASEGELGGSGAWQRLYQRGQIAAKRQERMDTIRKEEEEEELKECTFRPKVNSKSLRMVYDRQTILKESGIPGYEQLFNEAIRRRIKQEALATQLPEEATFRPRINTSSVVLKNLLEARQGGENGFSGGDVADRLLERGRKYQEKLQQARDMLDGGIDPTTGAPLFRPKINRAPKFTRNPAGQPIGEYLYSIQQERDERMHQMLSSTKQKAAADASSTYVNKRSEKLVEKLKKERFRAIFDYLCRGEAVETLNLIKVVQDEAFMDTIDPEVRADIEYAAKQLARYLSKRDAQLIDCADSAGGEPAAYASSVGGEVDCKGFHALMEEVLQRTTGISRQYLLPMPAGRKKFEEPTFQPAIDPNSKLIAARRRPENLPTFELLYKEAEEKEHKREEKKKLLEQAAMEECWFNPKLQAKQLVKEGRALKLAATLSSSRRMQDDEGSVVDQAPNGMSTAQQQAQFDLIERQIQDALVRLSLSGEAMAAAAAGQQGPGAKSQRSSIDYTALFGSPQDGALAGSSLSHLNPLEGGDTPRDAAALRHSTLEWCESGDDLVANVINKGQFEGLDLHAIASASIDVGGGGGGTVFPPSPLGLAVGRSTASEVSVAALLRERAGVPPSPAESSA